MEFAFRPLEGRFVRLEPFAPEPKAEIRSALDCDPDSWAIMPVNPMGAGFEEFWSTRCGARRDQPMAYAIRLVSNGRVVGISNYDMTMANQGGIEIGGTFLHPDVRKSYVNPEAKLLMLDHAFSSGAVRVQFSVDSRNKRSQAAVAKLGAVREGVLRRNRMTWTGYIRDTVVFSILDHEWPAVRDRLQRRIAMVDC